MQKLGHFLIVLLLWVSPVLGQKPPASIEKITLTPTGLGKEIELNARAFRGTLSGTEFFGVQVRAAVKDGTEIRVLVDLTSGEQDLPLGRITIIDGFGELRLINGPFSTNFARSISEINTVRLSTRDGVVAEGSFWTGIGFPRALTADLQGNQDGE